MTAPKNEHIDFLWLFESTRTRVYRLLLKHTGNEHAAEDMTQEIYLRLWRHRAKLKMDGAENYVFTITYRLLADWHRSKIRSMVQLAEDLPERTDPITPEQLFDFKEVQIRFGKTLAELSPKQQVAFELIREEELSYKEASKKLNTSVSTLEKRVASSLKILKKALFLFFQIIL